MVSVVKQLIDRYILNFDSLAEHMYRAYGICIVLEDYLDYNDLIDGVYQIYEKTGIMMQNQRVKSYSDSKNEFITLSALMHDKRFNY